MNHWLYVKLFGFSGLKMCTKYTVVLPFRVCQNTAQRSTPPILLQYMIYFNRILIYRFLAATVLTWPKLQCQSSKQRYIISWFLPGMPNLMKSHMFV